MSSYQSNFAMSTSSCESKHDENLDDLPEIAMKNFLDVYGTKVKRINLDLFRSAHYYESSQWMWRQSVTNIANSCPNLYELDLMICNRHKIRDLDLENIFKKCHNLRSLKIDAHFLNGYCFKKSPPLKRLEMEMCVRINDQALQAICYRLKSLCALHVTQLLILNDKNLARLVNSLKSLRELAIISHPNTKYEGLTACGLSVIENLPLKTLLIDGLSAATDQFLGSISRVNENKISKTLENLSIAFCFNIGIHGLKRLATLPNLKNINLNGLKKRDVSLGIEELAVSGHLVRLSLAEETNISAGSLVKLVEKSPNLRLLDLTNNSQALSAESAEKWITLREASKRPPLYVLTSDHLMWNNVHRPQMDKYGRMSVQILHSCPQMMNPEEVSPSTALSFESPFSLPKGILLASLRSGNRYRLLFQHLGHALPLKILQNETTSPLAHFVAKREAEQSAEFAPILSPASNYDPFSLIPDENLHNFYSFITTTPFSITDQPIGYSMDVHNQPFFNNPHFTHFSLDVLRLLLNTHAYEDGARIGDDFAKEGILFREDGTVVNLKALLEVRVQNWDTASVVFDQCQQRDPFKSYRAWRNCEQCGSQRRVESSRKRTNRCSGVGLQLHKKAAPRDHFRMASIPCSSTSGYRTQRSSFSEAFLEELPDLLPAFGHFSLM